VLLVRVWHGEQNSSVDMVHLSAKGAGVGALRLQIAHQDFHATFSEVLPLKVLMQYIQAMRDCA